MSRKCKRCPNLTGPNYSLCQICRVEQNNAHLGVEQDRDDGIECWILDADDVWHASMFFEDGRHVTACGEILECPVAGVREDLRWLDDVDTCDACEQALEEDHPEIAEAVFQRASKLRGEA